MKTLCCPSSLQRPSLAWLSDLKMDCWRRQWLRFWSTKSWQLELMIIIIAIAKYSHNRKLTWCKRRWGPIKKSCSSWLTSVSPWSQQGQNNRGPISQTCTLTKINTNNRQENLKYALEESDFDTNDGMKCGMLQIIKHVFTQKFCVGSGYVFYGAQLTLFIKWNAVIWDTISSGLSYKTLIVPMTEIVRKIDWKILGRNTNQESWRILDTNTNQWIMSLHTGIQTVVNSQTLHLKPKPSK